MLQQLLEAYWKEKFPFLTPNNCYLLLAVSGGLDSVVLTDLIDKTGFSFSIAHCNFQLRGEESNRDEAFVTALAKRYDKPLYLQRFDTTSYAENNKLSTQEAARKLRYDWFQEIIQQLIADKHEEQPLQYFVVTAHHANDNIETLLFNFFRGTGISGLHGILPKQNNLLRPLLFAKREAIAAYAQAHNLDWVEDSSNATDKYSRNFFRHQLLPLVKAVFPQAEDNLLHNISRFSEVEQLYRQAIDHHKKKLLTTKGNEVHIPVLKLQQAIPRHSIVWEMVKDYSFTAAQIPDIEKLLTADNGKYVPSHTHRIIRNRNWLIIAPLQNIDAVHILIEQNDTEIIYEDGSLQLGKAKPCLDFVPVNNRCMASLDAKLIHYPMMLRKWKQGDYFYPLGMKKKKKISRFLIDLKLSKTDKEKVWVLEMNKKIVWVIGYRIDDRFKITTSTHRQLTIEKR